MPGINVLIVTLERMLTVLFLNGVGKASRLFLYKNNLIFTEGGERNVCYRRIVYRRRTLLRIRRDLLVLLSMKTSGFEDAHMRFFTEMWFPPGGVPRLDARTIHFIDLQL